MLFTQTGEIFTASLQNLWWGFIDFVPHLILAIIVFIVGWVVGSVIGKAVAQVIGALKIDKALESTGADEVLAKAGLNLNVGGFIGGIVKWFIIVVFLMTALEMLGLTQVNDFLSGVVLQYLPKVIVASLVLIVATVIADTMGKIVSGSAKAANVRSANLLGTIARYAIWIFAFIIALSELEIASQYMQILFTGLVAMLVIAAGLAFGLGGKDAAARTIEKLHNNVKPMN